MFLILALTGFLSFYSIGSVGYANEYYSAAVKSMISSWHNFFYASFDPGGYVSVDKPALGLWLQAISAYVFGLHGWSLILPEALSSVISVVLVYHLVQRNYGKIAGLGAAIVMGLSPILIAVSKTNNLDSSLVMVLLFATWVLVRAAEKNSFKLLLLAMVVVGLGFNIKMLQAFMVLPALCLVYLLTAQKKAGRKILELSGAIAVLLVVSLSWALIVDLTPAKDRPYVGSSQTNSVIELVLGYNGIQRLTGREAGRNNIDDRQNSNDGRSMNQPQNGMGNGGPGGTGENGQKGVLRIFNQQLAGQISWLLPMALFGMLILLIGTNRREEDKKRDNNRQLILWTAWLLPMLVYFSVSGFFHRYYLSMMAPAIAALSGIGVVEMYRAYVKSGWKWILLPGALVTTALSQCVILSRYTEWGKLEFIIFSVSLISALVLIVIRILKKDSMMKTIKSVSALGFITLLIAPAIWSYTPILYGSQTKLPFAGPELKNNEASGQSRMSIMAISPSTESELSAKLIEYLLSHKQDEKYLLAVSDANTAAPIILKTGEAVMAVGGYSGSDNIMTVERLDQMVSNGEIRYFYIGGRGGFIGQSEITNWVTEHGKVVSLDADSDKLLKDAGNFTGRGNGISTLYDLVPNKD